MKKSLFVIILILISSIALSQVFTDEETKKEDKKSSEAQTVQSFDLYLTAGASFISHSGEFMDHVIAFSDRSSSVFTFNFMPELYYNINNNLKVSLLFFLNFPYDNTFYFTDANDNASNDKYQSLLAGLTVSYNLINNEDITVFPSAGIVIGKAKYSFSGAFVTKLGYLIMPNDDSSCMTVFGFIFKLNAVYKGIMLSAGYISTSGDLTDCSFVGYERSFGTNYMFLNAGLKILSF